MGIWTWLCGCVASDSALKPHGTCAKGSTCSAFKHQSTSVQAGNEQVPSTLDEERPITANGCARSMSGVGIGQDSITPLGSTSVSAPSNATMDAKLRVDFNQILFNRVLGKGVAKTVYRGRWNNTAVAVVSMRKGGMLTEARVLQRLGNHPNLVQFYRWSSDDKGNEYMIMELVKLGSLDRLLLAYGHMIRTRAKLMMCEQICSAMCELIEEGVLHRDLAARNILVQSMDPVHIKVTDFGLSRMGPSGDSSLDAQLLNSSASLSVPVRWTPPEVLTQGSWSEKSDVWSFGVTVWEIFSDGAEPYARKSDEEVVQCILAGELLPKPARCPRELYKLMLQCWAPQPQDRPTFGVIAGVFRRWREAWAAQQTAMSAAPVDDSGVLPSVFSPSGHLPAPSSGRLSSAPATLPHSSTGGSPLRTSGSRRPVPAHSERSRSHLSADGYPITVGPDSLRLMQCADANVGLPFSPPASLKAGSSNNTSYTGSGGSVAVMAGQGMVAGPANSSDPSSQAPPSSQLPLQSASVLALQSAVPASVSYAHEVESSDAPTGSPISSHSQGTEHRTRVSLGRLAKLRQRKMQQQEEAGEVLPQSGPSSGPAAVGDQPSSSRSGHQSGRLDAMESRHYMSLSDGGESSAAIASHISTYDLLTSTHGSMDTAGVQRSRTPSFNSRMMAELHGAPMFMVPGRHVHGGTVSGPGAAGAELTTYGSVVMSFDMESAIEPCMSHSTLNTMTQPFTPPQNPCATADALRDGAGFFLPAPSGLRTTGGSNGGHAAAAALPASQAPLIRSMSALAPRQLRPSTAPGSRMSASTSHSECAQEEPGSTGSALAGARSAGGQLMTIHETPAATASNSPAMLQNMAGPTIMERPLCAWPADVAPLPLVQQEGSTHAGSTHAGSTHAGSTHAGSTQQDGVVHDQEVQDSGSSGTAISFGNHVVDASGAPTPLLPKDGAQSYIDLVAVAGGAPRPVAAAALTHLQQEQQQLSQMRQEQQQQLSRVQQEQEWRLQELQQQWQQQQPGPTRRAKDVEPESLECTRSGPVESHMSEGNRERLALLQQASGSGLRRSQRGRDNVSAGDIAHVAQSAAAQRLAPPDSQQVSLLPQQQAGMGPSSPRAIAKEQQEQQRFLAALSGLSPLGAVGPLQVPDWVRPDLVARSNLLAAREQLQSVHGQGMSDAASGVSSVGSLFGHAAVPFPPAPNSGILGPSASFSAANSANVFNAGAAFALEGASAAGFAPELGTGAVGLPWGQHRQSGATGGSDATPSWPNSLGWPAGFGTPPTSMLPSEGPAFFGAATQLPAALSSQLHRQGVNAGWGPNGSGAALPAGRGYMSIRQQVLHAASEASTAANSAQLPCLMQPVAPAPASSGGYLSIKQLQSVLPVASGSKQQATGLSAQTQLLQLLGTQPGSAAQFNNSAGSLSLSPSGNNSYRGA